MPVWISSLIAGSMLQTRAAFNEMQGCTVMCFNCGQRRGCSPPGQTKLELLFSFEVKAGNEDSVAIFFTGI